MGKKSDKTGKTDQGMMFDGNEEERLPESGQPSGQSLNRLQGGN